MKAYQLSGPDGLSALSQVDTPEPSVGPYDVAVEMKAWSLNYRDLGMLQGGYLRNDKVKTDPPLVPLSDGAGEVVAIGDSVRRFKIGDRVASCFLQDWISGELSEAYLSSALGGAIDGVLAERVAFHEQGLVAIPQNLNFQQAATLPCAAVTAWHALTLGGIQAGDTVLMLGTGGVSIFALQLAKVFGARTIITSSSDEKLVRTRKLGADETINYRSIPQWDEEVRRLTEGRGVDNVIEVGGAGTLEKSLNAARVSGTVSLIGVLSGRAERNPSPLKILFHRLTLQGIYVGSREMFEAMNAAIEVNAIEPVIDRSFGFDEVRQAYEYLQSGAHLGKVVIAR